MIFSHPDCTVGGRISLPPVFQTLENSRTVTAGREFHPALKIGAL